MHDDLSDAEELRLHQLGALAAIAERAQEAFDDGNNPHLALAWIDGRAVGALHHVRSDDAEEPG